MLSHFGEILFGCPFLTFRAEHGYLLEHQHYNLLHIFINDEELDSKWGFRILLGHLLLWLGIRHLLLSRMQGNAFGSHQGCFQGWLWGRILKTVAERTQR